MLAEVRAALPGAARGARARGRLGGSAGLSRRRRRRAARSPSARRSSSSTTRSTSSTRRARRDSRRARRSPTTTSSTTGTSSRATLRLHGGGPGLRAGAVLPLLRHGDRQPRLPRPRGRASSSRRRASTRSRRSRPSPASAARRCTACRRCSSRSSSTARFAEFDLTSLRTGVMAGSPCPIETMRQVQQRMHMDEVTICYGMTETSPVSTQSAVDDPLDKRVTTVGRIHPHLEIKIVDPATGRSRAARRRRRALHPRLQRHARLLGRRGGDAGRDRPGGMDAQRRPGDDGRRRLREDRRPDQGHDHPRRREHLPARARGVPADRGGSQRGVRDRRPQRALRRGGDGLGEAEARARASPRPISTRPAAAGSPRSRSRATGSSSTRSR